MHQVLLMPLRNYCSYIFFFICCFTGSTTVMALPVHKAPVSRPVDDSLLKGLPFRLFPDPVISMDSPTCVIPFSRAGNLILLRAKADTTDGNFILDTGAPNVVLNITYFRNYPTHQNADEEQGGITSTGAMVSKTMIDQFTLSGIHYSRVETDMVNLGHLENTKGVRIFGLLGMQLFKQFEMIIDYENNLLYLHLITRKETSTYKSEQLQDTATYHTVPIELVDSRIVVNTEMGGKTVKLMIDCGAETNVLDSRLPNKVFESIAINRRILLNGSGSKKVEALAGDLNEMKIGNTSISNMPVMITNLAQTCLAYNCCIDGILGFDFLSLHKIGFNFVKRKMYIWK